MEISITFDTDWVHESAIEHCVYLLDKYNQKATFFSTNNYKLFNTKDFNHEIGIHPNFNDLLNQGLSNYKLIINDLVKLFPNAKGFRSHSLTTSSHILAYLNSLGFVYDSNLFHPEGGKGYYDYSGVFRFIHNYVDLGHLLDGSPLEVDEIKLSDNHINILDFHPIHVYLNTPTVEYYNKIKFSTNNKDLIEFRNKSVKGIGDLFIEILEHMKINKINSKPLIEKVL